MQIESHPATFEKENGIRVSINYTDSGKENGHMTTHTNKQPENHTDNSVTIQHDSLFFFKNNEKKKRTRTSPYQLDILQQTFESDPMPSASVRMSLAARLGMTSRSVQVWFQNRRAKGKNEKQRMTSGSMHCTNAQIVYNNFQLQQPTFQPINNFTLKMADYRNALMAPQLYPTMGNYSAVIERKSEPNTINDKMDFINAENRHSNGVGMNRTLPTNPRYSKGNPYPVPHYPYEEYHKNIFPMEISSVSAFLPSIASEENMQIIHCENSLVNGASSNLLQQQHNQHQPQFYPQNYQYHYKNMLVSPPVNTQQTQYTITN